MTVVATNGTEAVRYLKRGWTIVPLCWPTDGGCGAGHPTCSADPRHIGKAPIKGSTLFRPGQEAEAERFWSEYPKANIGIRLEESGLIVVDIDDPDAVPPEDRQRFDLYEDYVSTGRGKHIYFRRNDLPIPKAAIDLRKERGWEIRLRGYVVAPPSRHRSGKEYRWSRGIEVVHPEVPDWIAEIIRAASEQKVQDVNIDWDHLPDVDISRIPLSIETRELIRFGAPKGARSEAIWRVIGDLIRAGCDDATVAAVLMNPEHLISEKIREKAPEQQHKYVEYQIAKMRSEFRSPASKGAEWTNMDQSVASAQPAMEHFTDLGNAKRLVRRHGKNLRYCPELEKWLVYDGRRWVVDKTGEVMRRAKETVQSMYQEAAQIADEDKRKKLVQWALNSESASKLKHMVELAQTEPGIPVKPSQLDRDPWLLNCLNGTIDLRSGELRPHRRDDLITKLVPVEYDPDAKAPLWEKFLHRIMNGNQRLIEFLQRAVGYTLTGDTSEQVLFLLYGTGANGKSTFLEVLRSLFGDYGQQAEFSTFLARDTERVRNDLARLVGKRFVSAAEAEEGRRWSEVVIKQLTGGDTITARFLYREYFEFRPAMKLWLAANHKPRVRGTDYAIWRRLRLIPFTVTIPEGERDRDLSSKLCQELQGILAWAVQGCLKWLDRGLDAPPEVMEATNQYREEQDVIAQFIEAACVPHPNTRVNATDLYKAYLKWCEDVGERPVSLTEFGERLNEKGFPTKKIQGLKYRLGIGLLANAEKAQAQKLVDNDGGGEGGDSGDTSSKNSPIKRVEPKFSDKGPQLSPLSPQPLGEPMRNLPRSEFYQLQSAGARQDTEDEDDDRIEWDDYEGAETA